MISLWFTRIALGLLWIVVLTLVGSGIVIGTLFLLERFKQRSLIIFLGGVVYLIWVGAWIMVLIRAVQDA